MAAKTKTAPKLRPALPKTENNIVDFKSLISPKNLRLHKNAFAREGVAVDALTEEEIAEYIKTSPPEKILISLNGFRELAHKRGVKSVDISLVQSDPQWKIARCSIEFLPSEDEPEGASNSDLGDAHIQNTSEQFIPYMGALAANRAYIRAVRNYFRIESLGWEEINPNEKEEPVAEYDPRPAGMLNKVLEEKGMSFDDLKALVESSQFEWKDWKRVEEIPPPNIFSFKGLIK